MPGGSVVKIHLPMQEAKQMKAPPWVGKIPWRTRWQPTLVFLPGKSHEQRNLAGYRPWSQKRVRHNLVTKQQQAFIKHLSSPSGLYYSCLADPMDGGAWWAAVHGVATSSDTTEQLHFHFSLCCIGEGNGNPLQCSCLENPRDGEAWWAAVYGVAQSRTRLM